MRVRVPELPGDLVRDVRGHVSAPIEVEVLLDGDTADREVVERLGVLLLQLGPAAWLVSPADLESAAVRVGERLLALHPQG